MSYCVIFDIFGVLLSRGFLSSSSNLSKLLSRNVEDIRPVYEKWEVPFDLGRVSVEEFWSNIQKDLGTGVDWRELDDAVLESYVPLPGAFDLITRCAAETEVFCLSNTRKEWFEYLDKKFSISPLFTRMFLSYEIGLLKPHSACYAYVIREINRRPGDIVYLDDDSRNVRVAVSMGLVGTRYTNALSAEQFLKRCGILTEQ